MSRSNELIEFDWIECRKRTLALATTSSHSNSVDHKALLGLVAESSGFFRSAWTWTTVHHMQLTVFPASQTQQEQHHIALLLAPDLLDVLVGAHVELLDFRLSGELDGERTVD